MLEFAVVPNYPATIWYLLNKLKKLKNSSSAAQTSVT